MWIKNREFTKKMERVDLFTHFMNDLGEMTHLEWQGHNLKWREKSFLFFVWNKHKKRVNKWLNEEWMNSGQENLLFDYESTKLVCWEFRLSLTFSFSKIILPWWFFSSVWYFIGSIPFLRSLLLFLSLLWN